MPKARHTHGNTLHGKADFYPLLAKVGKMLSQVIRQLTLNATFSKSFGKITSVVAVKTWLPGGHERRIATRRREV
jgi:hypothetical protein